MNSETEKTQTEIASAQDQGAIPDVSEDEAQTLRGGGKCNVQDLSIVIGKPNSYGTGEENI